MSATPAAAPLPQRLPVCNSLTMLAAIAIIGTPLLVSLPELTLVDVDAKGCGRPALAQSGGAKPLQMPEAAPCVLEAFAARLEDDDTLHAVLTVVLEPGPRAHRQLFIYRIQGRRLLPRYLGSGPAKLGLLEARPADAEARTLRLRLLAEGGQVRSLICWFEGFPLLCLDETAANGA